MVRMAVAAAVTWAWLAATAWAGPREVVVGVEELDYLPAYGMQDGTYRGAARDILDAFAAAKGYRLSYKPLPIKRLFAELLSGGVDLKFPDNPFWAANLKNGQSLAYSKPVIRYIDGVMVRPGDKGRGLAEFRTLGTVAGFTPFAWLDEIKAGRVQVKENPRMDLLVRQVLLDRLDGAYASVAVVNRQLDEMGRPGGLVFDPSLPHSRDAYMLSSQSRPELVAEFDAWMAANLVQVQQIKDRWAAEKGVE